MAELTDNECYLIAKNELFPYEDLMSLSILELSKIIQRAHQIKSTATRVKEGE